MDYLDSDVGHFPATPPAIPRNKKIINGTLSPCFRRPPRAHHMSFSRYRSSFSQIPYTATSSWTPTSSPPSTRRNSSASATSSRCASLSSPCTPLASTINAYVSARHALLRVSRRLAQSVRVLKSLTSHPRVVQLRALHRRLPSRRPPHGPLPVHAAGAGDLPARSRACEAGRPMP